MDTRNKLLTDITLTLSGKLDADQLQMVVNKLTLVLDDYSIEPKSTALATVDTESEKMLKKFLATKRLEGRSEKTIERYRYIIQRFSDSIQIPFNEVDVFAMRLYLAQLEQDGNRDSTINGIRAVFSSFFGWLHAEGFIEKNPTANLGVIKCRKVIRKPFSKTELEIIRNGCKTLRDRAVVEFLLSTGCRIEETIRLNITDINFATQETKVLGKGNKERVVFINDVCILHLRKYLASRSDAQEALFIGKGSDRMTTGGMRAMLKRLEADIGVENIHPHRFRRTLATSLIDRGMPIQEVAAILGHVNINTTMAYIYTDTENVKTTYRKLVS